jgi:hypothetical protein
MATTLKLKNSVTTTAAPSALAQGEVAVNITDKKVWVGNAATTPVQIVGPGSTDLAVADGGTGASTASDARTNLGLAIGTDVQAYDADLTTIAGLTPTNNYAIIGNGTAWTSSALPTPASTLDDLTDVTITSPATDNVLKYNGTAWVNGTITVGGGGQFFGTAAVKAIAYNSQTIAENLTITTGNNGYSAGPITLSPGYAVTIQAGSRWAVI